MRPVWMPLYIADYRADTAHLNTTEHGAYLLLIMHYWTTGGLPNEDRQLARIACLSLTKWIKIKSIIEKFFEPEWSHKRINEELAHASDVIEKRRNAALARHHANAGANAGANAPDTQTQSQSQSERKKEVGAPEGEKGTVVDFPSPYAFEGEVIRLRQDQFDRWRNIFPKLHDLTAELTLADAYYVENPPKGGKWFFPVSKWLEKANREQAFKPKRKGVYGDDWW